MRPFTFLGVPIDSVGRSGGTEHAPAAFRGHSREGDPWSASDAGDLDETAFPATDYLMPGGLQLTELGDLLRPLLSSPRLAGISVGCYDPDKDPGGANGAALAALFRDVLTG
jgi:arginase family enzyme